MAAACPTFCGAGRRPPLPFDAHPAASTGLFPLSLPVSRPPSPMSPRATVVQRRRSGIPSATAFLRPKPLAPAAAPSMQWPPSAAVDPLEPEKVLAAASEVGAYIDSVLTTHHHWYWTPLGICLRSKGIHFRSTRWLISLVPCSLMLMGYLIEHLVCMKHIICDCEVQRDRGVKFQTAAAIKVKEKTSLY